jgi:aryl-alcohol dehydrogenase-like predicted oxidoreductase
MFSDQDMEPSVQLADLPKYVYGTTRLGDDEIPFEERVRIARTAADAGVWFHTSHTYGNALQVLRAAFDQDRTRIPKLIVKIGWDSIEEIREITRQNLEPLGLESLELGQLCLGGSLAEDFANGGACYEGLARMKEEGLVKRFVVEVFPWTSEAPLRALQGGYTEGIIDGFIFYLNPLQRFASNELWDLLRERNEAIVAMRTVAGGPVHRLRDVPGAAWKDYLQKRAVEVAPIFERSGITSWTEFCVRFAHSFPQVRATVGATARLSHLEEFLSAAQDIRPLPEEIREEIATLQYRWSDETDIHAEPWSM